MVDTGFFVPSDKLDRFTTQYVPDDETGELPAARSARRLVVGAADCRARPGDWSRRSTTCSRSLDAGADGGELLSPESVRSMIIDRMSAEERADSAVFVGDHSGWGLMMAVPAGRRIDRRAGGFGWEGGTGTCWRTDPAVGLTGILLTQRAMTSPEPPEVATDFWTRPTRAS